MSSENLSSSAVLCPEPLTTKHINVKLSEILWKKNEDKACEALHTDFIQGIRSGMLDYECYRNYCLQDAVYCHQATEHFKIACIKAEYTDDRLMMEYIKKRVKIITEYTNSMFRDWHIDDHSAIKLGVAAKSYIDAGRKIAETKCPFYFLVAMLPCEQLWRWLATKIKSGVQDTNIYSSWILNILMDNTDRLSEFVDNYAEKYNCDQNEADEIYRRFMEEEVNFFSSATLGCKIFSSENVVEGNRHL